MIAGVPGAFSAGNDLGDFMKAATGGEGLGNSVLRFLYSLARAERPLVAAVQGVAVGIGTTMMLHCDYAVAASDARFSTPFVALGLVPEAASSLLAPRADGSSPRVRAAGDGQAARRARRRRPAAWSIRWRRPIRSRPRR